MIAKAIPRALRWIRPLRKPIQEAADQQLAKQGKLTTFHGLTFEADLKDLAEADRESVNQFRAAKMGIGGPPRSKGDNKDAWVCDDMTINNGGGIGQTLLAVAAGALAVYLWCNRPQATQPVNPPVDSEYEVRFFDADGNPIELPNISER